MLFAIPIIYITVMFISSVFLNAILILSFPIVNVSFAENTLLNKQPLVIAWTNVSYEMLYKRLLRQKSGHNS